MATSSINFDLSEIIEEAFENATGGTRQLQTGYDYRTARRSLNLLTMEWANRGINLWTMEQGTIPLISGLASYQLPADTVDMIEFTIRSAVNGQNIDLPISRVSVSTYANMPNKTTPGRPQMIFLQRIAPYPVLTLWPVPDKDIYTLVGWRMRRIQDAGAIGNATMDIPFRFMPALIAGLSFFLSKKLKEGEMRAPLLKQEYEAAYDLASLEDREKAPLRVVPRISRT
jgi:hypothetical protein